MLYESSPERAASEMSRGDERMEPPNEYSPTILATSLWVEAAQLEPPVGVLVSCDRDAVQKSFAPSGALPTQWRDHAQGDGKQSPKCEMVKRSVRGEVAQRRGSCN